MADLQLETSVTRSGRGAHNDLAVTIGFNAALEPGQFTVGKKFGPTAQVKGRLRLVRRKFNRQRCHDLSLPFRRAPRQPNARQSPVATKRHKTHKNVRLRDVENSILARLRGFGWRFENLLGATS